MHEWITITRVFGQYVNEPGEAGMRSALEELFSSADGDHPDAWIECGTEGGPLYCISICASGYAIYKKYSDVDMTAELETKEIANVDIRLALDLWRNLAFGIQ